MAAWSVQDLETWDATIREHVERIGLDCYPQEFELCDHTQMLGYMAYSGMPSHYPHWSYGKAYEKLKTLYDHGVSGLPYEMVINSNPALAYLMRDNSLLLQILTIAHVYGHNDFFKNNFTFRTTRAEFTTSTFKATRPASVATPTCRASARSASRTSSTPRTRSRSMPGGTCRSRSSPSRRSASA
jgi:stage V sporulation protein R